MDVLWEMLDRGWLVQGPEELLFGRLGEANGERLLELGVLKGRPLVPGRCHGPRCGRRDILSHGGRWYAVCACDGDCGTTELLRHRRCQLDEGRLRRRLRALLELGCRRSLRPA